MKELEPRLSLLQQREIEARIVGPLIRAFAKELGEERAIVVLRRVIGELARQGGADLARSLGEQSLEAFARTLDRWRENGALEIELLEQSAERLSFNVRRCRYAEMYRALGLAELGSSLSCQRDFALAEGFSPDIRLVRTQTLMEGAPFCDFRFRREEQVIRLTVPGESQRNKLASPGRSAFFLRMAGTLGGFVPCPGRRVRCDKTAGSSQQSDPLLLLLAREDRHRLLVKGLLDRWRRPSLGPEPVALGDDACQGLLLLGGELQIASDCRPAEHCRDALPLQLDLPEPLELIPRQVIAEPFQLCLVDGPSLGHDSGTRLAAQGHCPPCELVDRGLNPQDLGTFEMEIELNVGTRNQEQRRSANSTAVVRQAPAPDRTGALRPH